MNVRGFPPALSTAYLVAWTTEKKGRGTWLDAAIYSEATPTSALDGSHGYPFTIAHARSSRGYTAARAKLLLNLERKGFLDKLAPYPSFARSVAPQSGSAGAPTVQRKK